MKRRKSMNRFLALMMSIAMTLTLVACNSGSQNSNQNGADADTGNESGETIKIGLMLQLSGSSPADSEELLKGCQ